MSSANPASDPSASLRLLIVEDNPINQKIASKALQRLGFHADVCSDGQEAVAAVKNQRYALILMDCMMPTMDGYEATRAIRALEEGSEHVPIVAFTADRTQDCKARCMAAGMDDYLTKPLDMQILASALERWVR